ncbi:MAG: Fic family protein [Treponema sp.]|nr:Fic family protein [Treponema sp.]
MDEYNYSYHGSESYCYPDTDVLINKLNIKGDEQLSNAERDITRLKLLKLFKSSAPSKFDFALLCDIHKNIFEDIYKWAGQARRGDFFSKGSSIFCRGFLIQSSADILFDNLAKEKYLCNLNKESFISRMAYYMGEVNALHPFREGNGRTAREFFRQLALHAEYLLDFSDTKKDELLIADINAFNGSYENLITILGNAVRSVKDL